MTRYRTIPGKKIAIVTITGTLPFSTKPERLTNADIDSREAHESFILGRPETEYQEAEFEATYRKAIELGNPLEVGF